jgi:vitamin B12 transporter
MTAAQPRPAFLVFLAYILAYLAPVVLTASLVASAAVAAPDVESITVTAHLTPRPVALTGNALSIVTRAELEAEQAVVASDVLRAVPGVSIARSGPLGAQTQLRLRGAEANHVMVMIDGIEANDPAISDEFYFENLGIYDVERIEVVRGAQSALWGSDALAGVINVVTRLPTAPWEAGGFAEGGAFGLNHGGARFGLAGERGALALSASRLESDGVNIARGGDEDDGFRSSTVNLRGRLDLRPGIALGLTARHTDGTSEFDAVDGLTTGLPTDAENETDSEQSYLRASARAELFEGAWTQELSYALTSTDSRTITEDLSTPERDFDAARVAGDRYGLTWQHSLRLTPDDGDTPGQRVNLAVNHERQTFRQRGAAEDFFGSLYDPNQDQAIHSTAYVAEYLATVGRHVSLSAGVRHDDNSDFDDASTWRTTAAWRLPTTGTRLHASYGTGQKAPTFVERFGFYPNQFVGNPALEPETSKGWDLGVEQRWLDGALIADVTYFRANLDNEINGFSCASFPCTATNEPGESRRRGVEVSVDATLPAGYALAASYTYSHSRADNPNTPATNLEREVRRPLHAAALAVTGRWFGDRLQARVAATYTSEREDDFFPPPFFFPAERVELDSYTLLTLGASYRVTSALEIYGRLENALDEDYEDVYGYGTPDRGAFAGLRLKLR